MPGDKHMGTLAMVVGLGVLWMGSGIGRSASGEPKANDGQNMLTVHIDGFKKSASGAT